MHTLPLLILLGKYPSPSHWYMLAQLVALAQPLVQVWNFLTWKFASRVALAQPLAYARPTSGTRSTTGPGLEIPTWKFAQRVCKFA
ncbi:hypothetical protein DEO72_LG6g407 [Vigna unguiculata]|uniref:Uncharacterized protein n=1 Tax=Vigna unguiculata TaxID=3917 RepID=A0A4D6M3A4_VIGUN|nr:hypothetical protein DEO72_LG6g407 [Vigna unguiculata]